MKLTLAALTGLTLLLCSAVAVLGRYAVRLEERIDLLSGQIDGAFVVEAQVLEPKGYTRLLHLRRLSLPAPRE